MWGSSALLKECTQGASRYRSFPELPFLDENPIFSIFRTVHVYVLVGFLAFGKAVALWPILHFFKMEFSFL